MAVGLLCILSSIIAVLMSKATRDEEAFSLLEGGAEEKVRRRLKREEEERLKLARSEEASGLPVAPLEKANAHGKWIPYADKMGDGIFYYNKVSRESRRELPKDYVKDKNHIMKSATFGMHFYH